MAAKGKKVRRFTVRFFMDRFSGAIYEVSIAVRIRKNEGVMWFECDCDAFDDEYWCEHAERTNADFDNEGGMYIALRPEVSDSEYTEEMLSTIVTDKDAQMLRDVVLHYGLIEVV